MEISKNIENEMFVFSISGKIDTITAQNFQDKIDEEIDSGIKKIILNFEEVEYVSSAGLRAILYLHKKLEEIPESEFQLKNVNKNVMEVFDMTGFSEFLKIL